MLKCLNLLFVVVLLTFSLGQQAFADDKAEDVAKAAKEEPKVEAKTEPKPEDITITKEELLTISDQDMVLGKDDAPVTIIEYASMSCSHCATFHNNTFAELKEKYIDTGKVKFVFRDFPLNDPALRGAMLTRCSGDKEKFYKFKDVLFSTQNNWATKKDYLEILSNIAKIGGMTGEEFDKCESDKALEENILKIRFYAANVLQVRSTPTFFINSEKHEGAMKIDYFDREIEKIIGDGSKKTLEEDSKEEKEEPEQGEK